MPTTKIKFIEKLWIELLIITLAENLNKVYKGFTLTKLHVAFSLFVFWFLNCKDDEEEEEVLSLRLSDSEDEREEQEDEKMLEEENSDSEDDHQPG